MCQQKSGQEISSFRFIYKRVFRPRREDLGARGTRLSGFPAGRVTFTSGKDVTFTAPPDIVLSHSTQLCSPLMPAVYWRFLELSNSFLGLLEQLEYPTLYAQGELLGDSACLWKGAWSFCHISFFIKHLHYTSPSHIFSIPHLHHTSNIFSIAHLYRLHRPEKHRSLLDAENHWLSANSDEQS